MSQTSATGYHPPTSQARQHKILILQFNTYMGCQLVETFRNDDEIQVNPNILYGTLQPGLKNIGELAVDCLIQAHDQSKICQMLLLADIFVFSLNSSSANVVQYCLKFLARTKQSNSQSPKRVICISSLLTWNTKRSGFESSPSLNNLDSRNSSQTYLMQLQNLCLNLNNLDNNIESFVVCAGLVYGYGEGSLFRYFKQALEQTSPLKIYGSGTNHIPMIHVEDLASIVRDLGFFGLVGAVKRDRITLPRSRYYFAVDSAKITQYQLIKCIAENLGNGKIEQVPVENVFLESNYDEMTIDCVVEDLPTLETWHTIGGFSTNIAKIVSEFNLYRGLKPNKIIVMGPPAAGKSKVADILEKAYGLPVLTVKKVLDELHNEISEFATQIKTKLEQIRAIRIEEERKIFEEAKKKKKGKKDPVEEFDPSKILPRLPEDQLIRVFKYRLAKSDCTNKGYILDGWPKTSKSCQALFKNDKKQIDETILPNAAFNIIATDDQIKQRIKSLPQTIKQSTHWNQDSTSRRLQIHSQASSQGLPKDFLAGKVDIKDIPINYEGSEQFIQFIERNGPLGFKKKEKSKEVQGLPVDLEAKEEKEKAQDAEGGEGEGDDQEQEQQEEDHAEFDLEKLTEHEKEILNEKSRPIRQYLIDNVIPQITEGLLEICKETPRDPIGYLIKFLENKEAVKHKNRR